MNSISDSSERFTILLVDDAPEDLTLISAILRDTYRVKVANSGEKALRIIAAAPPPDLILLDVAMPGISGYEVCECLKADPATCDIPVIFLTASASAGDEAHGFELGAVDYIIKPASPLIVRARVDTHLKLKSSADFLRDKAEYLENEIKKRTREVQSVQDIAILTMASLAETRDHETGNHIRRTQHYVKTLAQQLQKHPRYKDSLSNGTIESLYKSAPLHDIGKVGIPDRILLKPGRFVSEEFEIMKTHPILGKNTIEYAERQLNTKVEFLFYAKEIAYCHHEKWDGSGYPRGLKGDEIPLSARLMAVADVYDAVISPRVYRAPMRHDQAKVIIQNGAGRHFDPDIAEAFFETESKFLSIGRIYGQFPGDWPRETNAFFPAAN
ncbi:MAG: two-component system response regulator [Azoarcus sp.]|jgi:putative two-component system response regulator|nr:two-component system response regulator [Azoarcus sp.]